MSVSNLGPILTRFDVEHQTIVVISTWLDTYLAEIERQKGLNGRVIARPPTEAVPPFDANFKVSEVPQSIHGGIDNETFTVGNTPEVIVLVTPESQPEHYGDGSYSQAFLVSVCAIIEEEDEDRARWTADFYGGALMACMLQSNSLEGFADRVRLQQFPKTDWLEVGDITRLATNQSTYTVYFDNVINEYDGLASPYSEYGEPTEYAPTTLPEVETTDLELTVEPLE